MTPQYPDLGYIWSGGSPEYPNDKEQNANIAAMFYRLLQRKVLTDSA